MVIFDRAEVTSYTLTNVNIEERFMNIALTLTGSLENRMLFEGSDTVRTVLPSQKHMFKKY